MLERISDARRRLRPWHDPEASDYDILGIEANASLVAIRRAYLRQMKLWHPDRFPRDSAFQREAELATKCINEAYWALTEQVRTRSRPPRHKDYRAKRRDSKYDRRSYARDVSMSDGWDGRLLIRRVGLVTLILLIWLLMTSILFWVILVVDW